MKPGIPWWAENYMYAAGPGMGNPTKAPPAAGQIADGYQPHAAVSPQIWNHWRWMAAQQLAGLASLRISNWKDADTTGFLVSVGVGDAMYEPVTRAHLRDSAAIGGPMVPEESVSYSGGHRWAAMIVVPAVTYDITPDQGCCSAHNGVGDRTIVNNRAAPNHAICHSIGMGAWDMTWGATAIPAGQWSRVEHDRAFGLWIIGDAVTPLPGNDLMISSGPGIVFAVPLVPPGFIVGAGPLVLEHTHHDVGLVHPSDPGNMCWLALTATELSTSPDGNIWSPAIPHGFAGGCLPYCFDYSAYGTRWIGLIRNPALTTRLIISDDNFASWTISSGLATAGCPIQGNINAPTNIRIATDGFGDWVVVLLDTATTQFEIHVSWDNGVTWTWVHTLDGPSISANSSVDLWYGGGRFVIYLDDPTGPSQQVFLSLRGDG